MASIRVWLLAVRPKTLWAAVTPVMVGTALAAGEGYLRPLVTLAVFIAAVLIQIGANLANDVYDYLKGADDSGRLGPLRVTEQGLRTPHQVEFAMWLVFGLALLIGCYLVWVGGWPIVVIGLVSIAAAVAYTGGPWPFGYYGLGDVMVFIFFGLIAVGGTVYLHADAFLTASLWGAVPMGALATAILVVNNYRDYDTDLLAGKRTLAVRLGRGATRREYVGLLILSYLTPVLHVITGQGSPFVLLPLLTLPQAWQTSRSLYTLKDQALNAVLARTARLQLLYGVLFSLGWLL